MNAIRTLHTRFPPGLAAYVYFVGNLNDGKALWGAVKRLCDKRRVWAKALEGARLCARQPIPGHLPAETPKLQEDLRKKRLWERNLHAPPKIF